jgi:protein kinase-like protein
MAELAPGDQLAGYRIESVAGRGGMGVVYRAIDINLDRLVALKLISDELAQDDSFRVRFKRESRLAASIRHPNVITVFQAGEADGNLFIAMDYIDGTDLKALIASRGVLEPHAAAHVVWQVAQALDAAHAKTLVHRDVKPANVLIADQRGEQHAYLTDFGLTKNVGSETGMTKTGAVVGTIDYMAPEQIAGGPVDARVDIYSLGCVLWEALTGRVPFERDSAVARMFAHAHDPPPSLSDARPGLPPALDGVVARAMAKQPEDRYLSAGNLGDAALAAVEGRAIELSERSVAVGAAAPGHPTVAAPLAATVVSEPDGSRRRSRRLLGAGAAAVAALGVALVLLLSGGGDGGGGSGGNPKPLSKDAYQDAVIDASQDLTRGFVTVSPNLPSDLSDPAEAQQAARSLTKLRNTIDRFVGRLEAIEAPADIRSVHAQLIGMVKQMRSDVADAAAAASFGDNAVYKATPKQLEQDTNELDSLADDFKAKGYTRLSLGAG